ncbi:AraC family transcriptional regulator [Paenibacillus sp. 19GGS1-52]|nr:helix-turn-helix domain-containing protein [Paenibacillus sp. 19GGS1-52]ULO09403.1 AraC family transcriptional regulator [Paenibacillus sp. 19GGS1-52]
MHKSREIIIPDTCMDIIWEMDKSTGCASTFFSGINDTPFEIPYEAENESSHFGIRFHFWAVHYFADDHLRDVLNAHADVEQYFSTFHRDLGLLLAETSSITERITAAEAYLLRRLEGTHRTSDSMMNAVHAIINSKGLVGSDELQVSSGLSSRQLERLFREYIGVTPKQTADLVRFQNVWQELYQPSPQSKSMLDIVYAYRYSHQSHFNNNFKKYAGRTPLEALRYARKR